MAEPQSFGALLAKLRMARNLAQTRLAERADYDHSYISRLETGARSPSRDAVERLIRTLQSSQEEADALLEAAGYMPPSLHGVAAEPAPADRGGAPGGRERPPGAKEQSWRSEKTSRASTR